VSRSSKIEHIFQNMAFASVKWNIDPAPPSGAPNDITIASS
jgi:hypothetical protein